MKELIINTIKGEVKLDLTKIHEIDLVKNLGDRNPPENKKSAYWVEVYVDGEYDCDSYDIDKKEFMRLAELDLDL